MTTTTTINGLLGKAKRAIRASDASLKEAADYIAAAKAQGATQDRIAKAIGKSPGWVSGLLKWKRNGYKETPFGPLSKHARAVRRLKEVAAVQRAATQRQPIISQPRTPSAAPELAEMRRARAQAVIAMFGATISNGLRGQLIAALTALPSDHPAERVRRQIGMAWDELVVAAAAESGERSAAA